MVTPGGDRLESPMLSTVRSLNEGFARAKGKGTAVQGGDFVRHNKDYSIDKIKGKIHEALSTFDPSDKSELTAISSNLFTLEKNIKIFHGDTRASNPLLKEIERIRISMLDDESKKKIL